MGSEKVLKMKLCLNSISFIRLQNDRKKEGKIQERRQRNSRIKGTGMIKRTNDREGLWGSG